MKRCPHCGVAISPSSDHVCIPYFRGEAKESAEANEPIEAEIVSPSPGEYPRQCVKRSNPLAVAGLIVSSIGCATCLLTLFTCWTIGSGDPGPAPLEGMVFPPGTSSFLQVAAVGFVGILGFAVGVVVSLIGFFLSAFGIAPPDDGSTPSRMAIAGILLAGAGPATLVMSLMLL